MERKMTRSAGFRNLLAWVALAWLANHGCCAEFFQVTWQTKHAAPPPKLEASAAQLMPAFQLALGTLPEASIVALALQQPALLNLTEADATTLQPLTAARYRLIAGSALYANGPSALPYCFSPRKPATGLASVYVPTDASTSTPTVLFLHGYGGSFLWYQHYLSELFPNHIIICPAYGISCAEIPQTYIAEAVDALANRLKFRCSKPCLIGLSAGGFGACRLYAQSPQSYTHLICLAAYPPPEIMTDLGSHVRFLAGAQEPSVTDGSFQRQMTTLRRSRKEVQSATIPKAGHFFLLTHPEQATGFLRRWINNPSP